MNKTIAWAEGTFVNMTEPFTVMLTNEAQQFATDSNRKVTSAQSYYTDIIVIRGSQERTDYTIGNITSGSGITVSKNSKRVTFSVSAGTTIGADAGVIEIPITLDGQTVKKQFSWSCGKQGPQGVKGENGSNFAWNLVKGTGTPKEFKPQANLDNSCVGFYKLDLSDNLPSLGDKFTISCDIEWTQFTQGTGGTFSWGFQGSTDGGWNYDNPFTIALQGVQPSKDTLLSSSGSKHLSASCTIGAALVGKKVFEIGARFNYSDGTGMIKVSNLKIAKEDKESPWCLHPDELQGKDGKTSYFHVKYSNDGGKTFTGNSGEDTGIYMGSYTDYTEADSTDVKKYNWVKVSGDNFSWNLINNGKGNEKRGFFKNFSSVNATEEYGEITLTSKHGYIGIDLPGFVLNPRQYKVGKKVTWSYDIMYTKWDFPTGSNRQEYWMGQRYMCAPSGETATSQWVGVTSHNLPVVGQNGCELNKWFHVEVTKTIPTPASSNVGYQECINFYNSTDISATVTLRMKNVKLEYGDTATPWSPAQSDLEGRGVSQTVQYYLATSQASGVTSSTSGWSTDITTQKLTADKKYLWNCYQTKYSDGTSEPISTPKVIGVYGDKGQNAKNLSITPSSQYFKSTDGGKTFAPNTITIKPTLQGEISFGKWQYSIDGGVSFVDVVSGQKGLTISNNVLTVSKDSSLYSDDVTMVTFRAVANDSSFYDTCSIAKIYDVSDIGDGRNLLLNTSSYRESNPLERTGSNTDDYSTYPKIITSIDLSVNQKYTLQAKTDSNWATKHDIGGHSPSEKLVGLWLVSDDTNTFLDMSKGYAVFTAPKTTKYKLRVNQYSDGTNSYTIRLWDIKLEKGQSASGWSAAPEDVQTAILSTKSEISDVSLKVDKNKQAIEQRVEKTTYQQDLNLVKGDINKANEGLNKWRYEIYPKSLFASEYQGKSTMDVFAKNKNLTPSQSVLLDDASLSTGMNYGDSYIAYGLTFIKMSAAKSVTTTLYNDDGASFYVNGKQIISNRGSYTAGVSITFNLTKGWNCLEIVLNEIDGREGFKFAQTLSKLSECQLMNCYYGTPVARQSHITNQLVQNTTDIKGISTKVSKVTSVIGDNGENFTSFKNDYSDFKQTMNGFKTTVGQTYVTKDDFNGLEIGGRNLLLYSQTIRAHNDYYNVGWLTDEVETFNGCPVWSVKNQWGKLGCLFKSHVIDRGLVKVGDTLTYSLYAKTNNASGKNINCSYRFKGDGNAYWFNGSGFNVGTSWTRYSVTFTVTKDMLATDTYMNEIGFEETASMSGDDKVYYTCPKLERGTKATDYTPAPEDNEINGQNLASNLPSNWEQGSINYTANLAYGSLKSTLVSRLRTKDVFPVSGNITISAGTSTNSSKEELNFYYVLFDINKKSISHGDTWQSLTSPKIINCGDAKYMAIILRWGSGSTAITPSDISQICLKIERGTSATPFTLAPEDVNGKIVNVETIANQTANKFEWIVKGGDKSSSMVLTDDFLNIVANNINLTGKVTFNSLSSDAKNEIGKVAQSKVDDLQIGGRNLLVQKNITEGYLSTDGKGSFVGSGGGDQTSDWIDVSGNKYITVTLYEDFTNTNNSGRYCEYDADKNCINTVVYNPRQKSSIIIELKSNTKYIRVTAIECKTRRYKIEAGNKATDWTPAPEDVSQDATNKATQALADAKNYSSNAVKWVTNNGSSTTSLNSMVKKWTDGAVSDTVQINGGWIKANTITASKIAIGDFTNYCQLDKDTASSYGFTATDDTKGVWFTASPIDRDKHISQWFTCEGGQKLYVEYDLSTTVKGKVEASDTDISYLTSGIMIYAANGAKQIVSYTRSKGVTATSDGAITHVSLVETLPADTRFFKVVLQTNGQGNTFSGTLKIRNPQVRKATTGKLIVDGSITVDKIATDAITADKIVANAITAGKIATNAIKSRNYSYLSGNYSTAGTFLDLSDGKIISKNFSIDGSGNAYFKGAIESITGMIGGWDINNGYLSKGTWGTTNGMLLCPGGSGSSKSIGGSESISGWAITASDKFGVTKDGKLYASDGMFSGTINASKGIIGANGEGFYISNSGLYATYSSNVYEKSTRSFSFSKPSTNNFDFVFTYDNIDNDIVDKNNGIKESRIDYFRVNIEYSYSQTVTNSDSENNSDGDEATKDTDETETVTDSMTIDIDTSKLVLSSTNVSESGNILTYTLSYCIDYGSGYTNLDAYIQSLLSSCSSDYVLQNYSFSSNIYVLFNNVNTYACVSVKQLKYGQVFEVNENKVAAKNLEVKDSSITVINNSYQSTLSNSCLTLQSATVNSNSYNTVGSNPSILFKNDKGIQNIALVYTDYDSVKAPSCLTLTGNQGGEYFIAPNVQVRNKLYIGPSDSGISYGVFNKTKNLYYSTQGYHSFYVNGKGIAWIQYNGIQMSKNIMFHDQQGITAYDHSNWYMLRCYDSAKHKNTVALGNSHLSTSVYTTSSVWYNGSSTTKLSTTSSDQRLKEDFVDISKYENMFMDLNPITYKFHDGLYNVKGTKPLRTWGFIADQVIDSFNKNGLDWKDEELVTIDRDGEYTEEELKYVDNHTMLKMNYQNMISLNTHMIQKTRKELEQVKQEKADLEARLQAIEAKLGL